MMAMSTPRCLTASRSRWATSWRSSSAAVGAPVASAACGRGGPAGIGDRGSKLEGVLDRRTLGWHSLLSPGKALGGCASSGRCQLATHAEALPATMQVTLRAALEVGQSHS